MTNPYKVFHSPYEHLREHLHVILVHPEISANVGSTARALENMGLFGKFLVVGEQSQTLTSDAQRLARQARNRLDSITFFPTLREALGSIPKESLSIAATARIGSCHRPHPIWAREAIERAVEKLAQQQRKEIVYVFGRESAGLTNEEVALCDWVTTIPSTNRYRSLNLAQAVMVFAYETNMALVRPSERFQSAKPSQKEKLVQHFIQLAEQVNFILPGDPYKMRPRLEQILSQLPDHIKDVKTLHGFLEQASTTIETGVSKPKQKFKNLAASKRNASMAGTETRI